MALRTHTCGELRLADAGKEVSLCGWVQRSRDKGSLLWIDLRDRHGLTQLLLEEGRTAEDLLEQARAFGREFVIQAKGKVIERASKNPDMPTGDIEIDVEELHLLNRSELPPFLIEEETDGHDELRMQYRYLDLRRGPLQRNLYLRHKLLQATRNKLSELGFMEVETPFLIKSTPEGARDFVVPSRNFHGQFYALPQSPQTFKQLLMVSGFDRYFQIVKCFRDEDFRADRQPEFTQIDCELSFVEEEDIYTLFEEMVRSLFREVLHLELPPFPRMTYDEAMENYGNDRPDLRFEMKLQEISELAQGKGFKVFDSADYIGGIVAKGCADYSRKQLDQLTKWVQRPQIGAKGLVYVKCHADGSFKSSVDKFFDAQQLQSWQEAMQAEAGDLLLLMAGEKSSTLKQLSELRLHMGDALGLRKAGRFAPVWITEFPVFEYDEEEDRYVAMHHPFTAPLKGHDDRLSTHPGDVKARAYDLVLNGSEIGGGSIRIHDRSVQEKMFKALGFTEEEAREQFGFLMQAFEYGAPPHGGIAFGFDRLVAIMCGANSIRDVIAFPKNNSGRDVMLQSPAPLDGKQLNELGLEVKQSDDLKD